MTKMLQLEVPGGGDRVLLHSCCAPCSGAVLECLVANGIRPVVFFSNSNIVPREEYELRLSELRRYCESLGVPLVEDEYDHEAWLDFVLERKMPDQVGHDDTRVGQDERAKELAAAPERGPRCLNCFKFRLMRAARYAAANGIPVLTTTLASSRWKSLEQVDEAGRWACGEMPGQAGQDVVFWPQNWRKGGLQPRRSQIICEQGFYNQTFCGCEFSRDSSLRSE
ncbi:MAG: epoxyqueuosine reductase QueH [Bacteroidales bacterium]|nr:epoxyqueuosine reductase QueH [Bacteroidales bacterium]